MYVMEGMGAVLPLTQSAASAVARGRVAALNAAANQSQGFGDVPLIRLTPQQQAAIARQHGGLLRNVLGEDVGGFVATWGLPIGAGLGAFALGLVIAKKSGKR